MEGLTQTWEGKVVTGLAIGTAILIGIAHHKEKGFWIGVGAMFLAGITVKTYGVSKAK